MSEYDASLTAELVAKARRKTEDDCYFVDTITGFQLADQLESAARKIEALQDRVNALEETRAHSCTCVHGEGWRPLAQHDKDCPIRVNVRKRIAPELALSRIAAAIDSGEENEQLETERDALRAEVERLRKFISDSGRPPRCQCDLWQRGYHRQGCPGEVGFDPTAKESP